jgi:hypothetical protein
MLAATAGHLLHELVLITSHPQYRRPAAGPGRASTRDWLSGETTRVTDTRPSLSALYALIREHHLRPIIEAIWG